MDNLATNKSSIPCQSWVGQNGWSGTAAQGPLFNPQPSSRNLSLGSSSDQRTTYEHLQAPNQSCMSDISSLPSTHHSALYKASHICTNSLSTTLFANTAVPSSSHSMSFAQQSPPASSLLLTVNQGKNAPAPSLPQTDQVPQSCRPQHLPLLATHDPYKASFQPTLTNHGLPNGLQDLPISLPSCGQRVSTCQATFEGENVEFATVFEYTHGHASFSSQEQHQWIPSSHCRGKLDLKYLLWCAGMLVLYWREKSLFSVVKRVPVWLIRINITANDILQYDHKAEQKHLKRD